MPRVTKERNEEKLRCYYIGAIQYAWKKGERWRLDVDKLLRPLGIEGINPHTVEEQLFAVDKEKEVKASFPEIIAVMRDKWKRKGKWKEFHKHMWLVRLADIKYGVLSSDFVVLYWQIGVEKGGTLDELYCAIKCGVPIFVVINQPIHAMNDWVLDVIREVEREPYSPHIKEIMKEGLTKYARIFRSFKALARYISEHKEELLAKKEALKDLGILEFRKELAPLFLRPLALFDYVWSTKEQYRIWLKARSEYQIPKEDEEELYKLFKRLSRR